ncbi:hypothetical protein LOTGIDRAFT_238097 [Lottia gigantea]|uniref:CW-type domain-containing protein n=1 Tax=Lottia gigantea TaxID=225164 RepID=V4AWQ6_LOTGI|nr:hypothetical protein LOTGIDRAFT_238097 [Lottia gigantea]ESP01918.1 hypothetical protein LOTGIDRAFT_238097 [Lottia gigantea]
MATRHFTRSRKQQILADPTLVEKDEDLQKQLKEVNEKDCRSISECSTCIRFYTEHATYRQYMAKKRKRKTSELDELKREIESTAWIQCDNLDCRKWRRVPTSEVDQLADKDWFCTLNKDPKFNNCEVPEEDTEKYDQLAINCGLNYVKSEFWEGCLVWAKMPGYCSWPAVVTRSLETDDICERDADDNPVLYHVEYLGKTHSRGWIKKSALKMFSAERIEDDPTIISKKGKKSNCSKTTFRKNGTVEHATSEAVILSHLTPFQRLDKCVFKFTYTYEDVTAAKNKLGIDITFFDETPPSKDEVKTPSEFEEAVLPVESAHKVPNMEMYSNPMSDLDSQEELIHEMQALQDGMEIIDQVLEQL